MDVEIKIPTRTSRVLADQASVISLIHCFLQCLNLKMEFTANINKRMVRLHGKARQQTSFDQFMRVMTHNFTVFTCAGFRFIGIDDQIMRFVF